MNIKGLLKFLPLNATAKPTEKENKLVKISLQKFEKTYKLLEEYDKKSIQSPEELADPGRLRKVVRELQKPDGDLGAHSTI